VRLGERREEKGEKEVTLFHPLAASEMSFPVATTLMSPEKKNRRKREKLGSRFRGNERGELGKVRPTSPDDL